MLNNVITVISMSAPVSMILITSLPVDFSAFVLRHLVGKTIYGFSPLLNGVFIPHLIIIQVLIYPLTTENSLNPTYWCTFL